MRKIKSFGKRKSLSLILIETSEKKSVTRVWNWTNSFAFKCLATLHGHCLNLVESRINSISCWRLDVAFSSPLMNRHFQSKTQTRARLKTLVHANSNLVMEVHLNEQSYSSFTIINYSSFICWPWNNQNSWTFSGSQNSWAVLQILHCRRPCVKKQLRTIFSYFLVPGTDWDRR